MDFEQNNHDCSRGCIVERDNTGTLQIAYNSGCCKLADFNWLEGIEDDKYKDLYEVRFKNTRKLIFRNDTGQSLKEGDLVVVEAVNGHDLGIVTLSGAVVLRQMARRKINPETYQFKKIYRKAKALDIERWQEAIAREHSTMIRARQLAANLHLDMKIGDVEFQGDGTKAIFYYIADERVDFRQLIKDFAEEFHIRVEMKQIGARQEAGLIGGLGVCGRPLCCSKFMADFKSITTQAARCQDLALNPQKLAGQCSKLKCCINYEASTYIDARKSLPDAREPLDFSDGLAYLVKTDVLMGTMWFSFDKNNMANMFPLSAEQVEQIKELNRHGRKGDSVIEKARKGDDEPEFVTAVGDDSISRFDAASKKRSRGRNRQGRRASDGPREASGEQIAKAEGALEQRPREAKPQREDRPRRDAGQRREGGERRDENQRREGGERRDNQQRSGRQGGNRHGRGNRPQKNNDGNA